LYLIIGARKLIIYSLFPYRRVPSRAQSANDAVIELRDEALQLAAHISAEDHGKLGSGARQSIATPRSPTHETTLIVYGNQSWTADFRQFVRLSWRMQQEALGSEAGDIASSLSKEVQIVVFHPQAVHQTYSEGPTSASDYTIRSPYPTLHLLRESDVLRAVRSHPNPQVMNRNYLSTQPYHHRRRYHRAIPDACSRRCSVLLRSAFYELNSFFRDVQGVAACEKRLEACYDCFGTRI
jgi:hypothetical protein